MRGHTISWLLNHTLDLYFRSLKVDATTPGIRIARKAG